jgi:hypothetical protein
MEAPVRFPQPRGELEWGESEKKATWNDMQEGRHGMGGERAVETPQFRWALGSEGVHDVEVGQQPGPKRIEPLGEVAGESGPGRRRGHAHTREKHDATPEAGAGQPRCTGRRHGGEC